MCFHYIIVGIIIVAIILVFSTFYVTKAGDESVSKLHTVRVGSDILALLDNNGAFDSLSAESIAIELNSVLPINYHIRIRVQCDGEEPIIVETTDIFPNDRFIGTGKRVFITNADEYCVAGFSIWLK